MAKGDICSGQGADETDYLQMEIDASVMVNEYWSAEDDDAVLTKSTIPTVGMLSVFTRQDITDATLNLEVVDQYNNIVMAKEAVSLKTHAQLKSALVTNNQCRRDPESHISDKVGTASDGRLTNECFPLVGSSESTRRLEDAMRRRLRGKKKKKGGGASTATGFYGVVGTNGESRRREFGSFSSNVPHVFTRPYVLHPLGETEGKTLAELDAENTGRKAERKNLLHWFWWDDLHIDIAKFTPSKLGLTAAEQQEKAIQKEIAEVNIARPEHERLVEAKMRIHDTKQVNERKKQVMVYGLDFGSVWERYQKADMMWGDSKTSDFTPCTPDEEAEQPQLSTCVKVLQVQPTDYGYIGEYDSAGARNRAESAGADLTISHIATGPEKWDCHDLLKSAFELDYIPQKYVTKGTEEYLDGLTEVGIGDKNPPRLFVRIYKGSKATCAATKGQIAVALSATTVFDECNEYSPWRCDRPTTTFYAYCSIGVVGVLVLLETYRTFRSKSAKTFNEDD